MIFNTILPSLDQRAPNYLSDTYDRSYSVEGTNINASISRHYYVTFDAPGVYYLTQSIFRKRTYRPPNSSGYSESFINYKSKQSVIVVTEPKTMEFEFFLSTSGAYASYIYYVNVVVFWESSLSGSASISSSPPTETEG